MSFDSKTSYPIGGKRVQGGLPTNTQILQFDGSTNSWRFVAQVAASLSEIEFIRDQVIAGNWFEISGPIDALGDKIVFIPVSGKTAFLYEGKIVITGHAVPSIGTEAFADLRTNDAVEADIIIDAVVKDTTNIGMASRSLTSGGFASAEKVPTNAYGNIGDGRFNVKGLSLVGDGVKEIAIQNVLSDGTANATMSGFIQNT